jgi:hypothetical protein
MHLLQGCPVFDVLQHVVANNGVEFDIAMRNFVDIQFLINI